MFSISSNLLKKLRDILLECGSFESYHFVHDIFGDPRLEPWKHLVPERENPVSRVNGIMTLLMNKYNSKGENALRIFLQVVNDGISHDDICHQQIQKLIDELSSVSNETSNRFQLDQSEIKSGEELRKLCQVLISRFNLEEIHSLCFDLNIDYDSLSGRNKKEKVRELLLFLKRRQLTEELISLLKHQRPDIDIGQI